MGAAIERRARHILGGPSILQTNPEAFNSLWSETKSKLQVTL